MHCHSLHHVGVAVHTIASASILYQHLGFSPTTPIYTDPIQRVHVQFFGTGTEALIELVEPSEPSSPISGFLAKHGQGLHHLCYPVDDIEQTCREARERGGIITCQPMPAVAFQGRRIAFVYWDNSLIEFLEKERGAR